MGNIDLYLPAEPTFFKLESSMQNVERINNLYINEKNLEKKTYIAYCIGS